MDEVFNKLGININFEFAIVFASLLWIRMLTITSLVPFLFGKPVPRKMRIGAAMVIMFFLYPILKPESPPPMSDDHMVLFALYLKEAFVGLCLGLTVSFMFYGFEAAGRMVDNQRGASLARILIPQLGTQGSLSGMLLFQLAIVLYLSFGGHLVFLNSVFESYQLIPVFEFPNVQPGLFPMMNFFIILAGNVLAMAVQIAAPVIISILLSDIILGITNRVAPQINVWEMGFNIRGFVGIMSLFFALTIITSQIYKYTGDTVRDTDAVIELFEGGMPPEVKDIETPPEFRNIFVFDPTKQYVKPPSIWDKTIKSMKFEEAMD